LTGSDPDEDLVRRIALGERAAIEVMVRRKLPRLLALAQRMLGEASEAEDVAQEALLAIWRHAGRWRPGGGQFDTWLHRVGMNLCHDRLRRRREQPVETVPDSTDPGPLPDAALHVAHGSARVERALQAIAPRQREAIVLTYYQELANVQAAAAMDISVEALESLLARARQRLRVTLGEEPQ
jgi:RNA polymerase sigma factor (sigma-70 family)